MSGHRWCGEAFSRHQGSLRQLVRKGLTVARMGKVERCIQNLNREFVHHLREFPDWLDGKLRQNRNWFNRSRYHRGVKAYPAELYECNVRKLT